MTSKRIWFFVLIICLSLFPLSSSASSTTDYKIMNKPTATKQQIKTWAKNKNAGDLFISLIDTAYDMAVAYEIDPTVLISQTALETNYCKYGGVLDESYHNTAGIKTTKGGGNYDKNAHQKFDSWKDGFEAQAQHLRLYAGYCHHYREDCPHECPVIIDPRHFKEIGGKAIYVSDLSRAWASDSSYGNILNSMCTEIVNTKAEEEVTTEEPLTPIEKIKARVLSRNSNSKIVYIKDVLFNKDKDRLMRQFINNKFKK